MSSFYRMTKNPKTGEFEYASWHDTPSSHEYRVEFPDGAIYNESAFEWEFKYDKDEV